jgi:hypothetical protein
MNDADEDVHERPTLPAPPPDLAVARLRFETPVEQFFATASAAADEELTHWIASALR